MKGDFHPPRDVDLVDGALTAEAMGWIVVVERKCLPGSSLTTYTVSNITVFYILLTSIRFTNPFPQISLLVRPTINLD